MALDKAINSGKEHRKQYHDSRSFDMTCRNHGSCPYCEGNRKHKFFVDEEKANDAYKEFLRENEI